MANANIGGGIVPGLCCVPHPRSPPESRVPLNPSSRQRLCSQSSLGPEIREQGWRALGAVSNNLSRTRLSHGRAGLHQDRTAAFCTTDAGLLIKGHVIILFHSSVQFPLRQVSRS